MLKKLFFIIFIATFMFLSFSKFSQNLSFDLSQNRINSLSADSEKLLAKLEAPLTIKVYSPNINILNICSEWLNKYTKLSKQINIELHQTTLEPTVSSKFNISSDHNLLLSYKNQEQAIDVKIHQLSEQVISTLIHKVISVNQSWLVFLNGHAEADPFSTDTLGLSNFTKLFNSQGIHAAQLDIKQSQHIPDNTDLIIVVNPQTELLPLEKNILKQYLSAGGKLLWFTEPGSKATGFIDSEFGLSLANGVAIDPDSVSLGSPHPALKIITSYPQHPMVNNITTATLLPWSGHLYSRNKHISATIQPFLTTSNKTWTYPGNPTQDIQQLAQHKEQVGPLNIGVTIGKHAVIIADSSFITNKYLPLYANQQLAKNIVNWLQIKTPVYSFTQTTAKDLNYQPNKLNNTLYRFVFPILIPLVFIVIGFYIQRGTKNARV